MPLHSKLSLICHFTRTLHKLGFLFCFFCFGTKVLPCSPACPGTRYVERADLELIELSLTLPLELSWRLYENKLVLFKARYHQVWLGQLIFKSLKSNKEVLSCLHTMNNPSTTPHLETRGKQPPTFYPSCNPSLHYSPASVSRVALCAWVPDHSCLKGLFHVLVRLPTIALVCLHSLSRYSWWAIPEPGPKASTINTTHKVWSHGHCTWEEELEHTQVSAGSIALLFLLQQITRDLEALKITSLFSHSSGGQKSKMSSAGLNSDANRTGLFLGLPGLCHLLVAPCGSFIHFQSRSFNFISFIWYTAPFWKGWLR